MKKKIAVLAGDGIGPEIMKQGVRVLNAVAAKFGHEFTYQEALCGATAIDKVGDPFPDETFSVCKDADAVFFAAVGDPRYDNDPTRKVRPETGLLAMRKKLGLFANVRPVQTFKCLAAQVAHQGRDYQRGRLRSDQRADRRHVLRREISGQRQGL